MLIAIILRKNMGTLNDPAYQIYGCKYDSNPVTVRGYEIEQENFETGEGLVDIYKIRFDIREYPESDDFWICLPLHPLTGEWLDNDAWHSYAFPKKYTALAIQEIKGIKI